jgi:hypothetical protein
LSKKWFKLGAGSRKWRWSGSWSGGWFNVIDHDRGLV